ncbi:MAG TPA: hypothetical protein VHL53_03850 [Acidimicrobiia bacterium]|nr:hypothetical protein [Acidimicrobiia bacterium]
MPGPSDAPLRFERRGVVIPFLLHQVFDYLAGLYLIQAGSKSHGRAAALSYGLGAVVIVAAMLSGKPLGGGRLSRKAHRVVDIGLVVVIAVSPFVAGLGGQATTVVRFLGLAVLLGAVVKFTTYIRPERGATVRALKQQGPRLAGQMLGRRMSAKKRPPPA